MQLQHNVAAAHMQASCVSATYATVAQCCNCSMCNCSIRSTSSPSTYTWSMVGRSILSHTSNLAREGPASLLKVCAVSRNLKRQDDLKLKQSQQCCGLCTLLPANSAESAQVNSASSAQPSLPPTPNAQKRTHCSGGTCHRHSQFLWLRLLLSAGHSLFLH